MNKPSEDDGQSNPGYDETQPKPRKGGEPDANTPHEHQNVPDQKPQPTP